MVTSTFHKTVLGIFPDLIVEPRSAKEVSLYPVVNDNESASHGQHTKTLRLCCSMTLSRRSTLMSVTIWLNTAY